MKSLNIRYNNCLYSNFSVEHAQEVGIPQAVIDLELFNSEKSAKLAEINAQTQKELSGFTATYPLGEVSTFDKQETEAKAYISDNAASTPLLDALVISRGIDKTELANRVIAKAELFASASGAAIGKRQKLEDQLNALTFENNTLDDISAISW